ncbi:ABC transporter substrate-binding protein [Uliginosibacterium sp. TH139]|uniref:substrate-binding periplasmic protein n=1 Tax=Uliginosibacterium sp. TH139 TaxID=2067453 RepID=UPI000C7BB034|nr:transporter substrate-binding domain-containing protein [Uliginosibacterium sp. TH139]PLK50118.1 ABC transporter substrate-binding protein [Uliginosibacterium sp. TH139]
MLRPLHALLLSCLLHAPLGWSADGPDCSRAFTLALHEHGQLYASPSDSGIDRDIADELIRRSGCKVTVTLIQRARIWQLIESGALDFSLSGISNAERDKFAGFAWYFSNKYYLLVRRDAEVAKISDFARNRELQLGAIRGFRYSATANALVDQLAEAQRVSYASGLEPLYQLLQARRIQGMIIEPFDYPAIESDKIREISQILEFGDAPVPHGLIMSKKSLSTSEQDKWRALIRAMRADGSTRRIFEKYFPAELARTLTEFKD